MNNKILILALTVLLNSTVAKAQLFNFSVSDTDIVAIPGSGTDIKLNIDFKNGSTEPVYLSAITPIGIRAIFQPSVVTGSRSVILSIIVEDSLLAGAHRDVTIYADAGTMRCRKCIHLDIPDDQYIFSELSILYRDSALNYLYKKYPEIRSNFGDLKTFYWNGFWPYPYILVVSHYNFLYNDWRITVQWHNMIFPYNWERVFIWNDKIGFCKAVRIDSVGNCHEIAGEKWYYYQQPNPDEIDNSKNLTDQISLFPIPAKDQLFYRSNFKNGIKNMTAVITDQNGKCMDVVNLSASSGIIDIRNYLPGLYSIRFAAKDFLIIKKFIAIQ